MTSPDEPALFRRGPLARSALHLRRGALIGGQLALVLPFVIVEDCNGAAPEWPTGLELMFGDSGWPFGVVSAVAVTLLLLTFRAPSEQPGWRAFGASLRALVAAAAGLVVGGLPMLIFMFDTVVPQVGWVLAVTCWSLLYAEALIQAGVALRQARAPRVPDLWDPVCRILRWVILVVPWPIALLVEPDLDEAMLGAGVVVVALCVPLWFVLTACVAGMRRREPWAAGWAPVLATAVSAAAALSAVGASIQ